MPPRIRQDDVYDQGGIEVVVIDDEDDGAIVDNRILFVPPQHNCEDDALEEDETDYFDESVELTGNFLDQLMSGLGCAGCAIDFSEPPPKTGILKKPGEAHSLNSRNVSFSSLDIKEFDLTLGNVSSCAKGTNLPSHCCLHTFFAASQFVIGSPDHDRLGCENDRKNCLP